MRDIIRGKTTTDAWMQAAQFLVKQDKWQDYNLILEIKEPLVLTPKEKRVAEMVDAVLIKHQKHSLSTVINTIFPAGLVLRYGATGLRDRYSAVRQKLSGHPDTKWGTYFHRMISKTNRDGKNINPLETIISKLQSELDTRGPKRGVYELSLIEPFTDIPIYDPDTDANYRMGGPCLSHLSFKLTSDHQLILTALYRYHYYLERALGNLYGLAMLQDFVAKSAGIKVGPLVCHSTLAYLDHEGIPVSAVRTLLNDSIRHLSSAEESSIANV